VCAEQSRATWRRDHSAHRQGRPPPLSRAPHQDEPQARVNALWSAGPRWGSVSRAWLDAREKRDLEALAALTHEHAVWESPVEGILRGRARVVEQVRAGFAEPDSFSSQLLSFQQRGHRAVAIVRNTGRRDDEELDSQQALHFKEQDGLVALVRIVVDDPDAVAKFWED
jgi:ketosteroid isomerase-like protein